MSHHWKFLQRSQLMKSLLGLRGVRDVFRRQWSPHLKHCAVSGTVSDLIGVAGGVPVVGGASLHHLKYPQLSHC